MLASAVSISARAFLIAARIVEDGRFDGMLQQRDTGWNDAGARDMLAGRQSLKAIAAQAEQDSLDPQPRSGRLPVPRSGLGKRQRHGTSSGSIASGCVRWLDLSPLHDMCMGMISDPG